mmetsp:Transcript_3880/g.7449  ORF Transcript_3880/g.7449 Transcript_3880/m.7449 type:complete len:322 (+) Transcript_3880:168-1133(+)
MDPQNTAEEEEEQEKSNPLLYEQTKFLNSVPHKVRQEFFSNEHTDPNVRAEIWSRQANIGEELVNQYAWATPDKRCMKILKFFGENHGGIVEIGCGSNAYWARMMHNHGIDVMGFDALLGIGGKISEAEKRGNSKSSKKRKRHTKEDETKTFPDGFVMYNGGPEVLKRKDLQKRVLFLCYPDEDIMENTTDDDHDQEGSMGAASLEYFKGRILIHVGEVFGDTPSMDQAPWGRSSGSAFQQRLASEFHCILKASMKNWLHVNDTISVWKRTELCSIVFQGEDEDESDEEVEYRHIPVDERLPMDVAAPCVKHLLELGNEGN